MCSGTTLGTPGRFTNINLDYFNLIVEKEASCRSTNINVKTVEMSSATFISVWTKQRLTAQSVNLRKSANCFPHSVPVPDQRQLPVRAPIIVPPELLPGTAVAPLAVIPRLEQINFPSKGRRL
jgi:hypothetical protein